jgi:ubiquinone/menaquinone biosynthesis C-methylase UbiE
MASASHDFGKTSFDWENYDSSRPQYPEELFETMFFWHVSHGGGFERALDCGCGTGNVLQRWAPRFNEVHALDFQTHDIILKDLRDKVITHEGPAEDLKFLPDSSVDFVAAAAAAHWFDRSLWIPEVARVLKPGGTLALWSHHALPFDCDGSRKLHDLYKSYFMKSLQGLFTSNKSSGDSSSTNSGDISTVQGHSHGLSEAFEYFEFPAEFFGEVQRISWNRPEEYPSIERFDSHGKDDLRRDPGFMSEEIDYERLRGYHRSLSNFEERWLQSDPGAREIVEEEWAKIAECFKECSGKREIFWPCFLVLTTRK